MGDRDTVEPANILAHAAKRIYGPQIRTMAAEITRRPTVKCSRVEVFIMQVTSRSLLLAIAILTAWFAQLPAHAAGDTVVAGELVVGKPTSISLFFEWAIAGDTNRNAAVAISFRKKGSSEWHVGPQMVRMMTGKLNQGSAAKDSLTSEKFVGGIPSLEPDTEYECRFVMYDPDGVEGASSQSADARTLTAPLSDKR